MAFNVLIIAVLIVLLLGVPVGLYFAIRSLIRYNAKLKQKKSPVPKELDKMKLEDL